MTTPQKLSPINVPSLLRRFGLSPNKRLGQNFLVDETALRQVVDAAEIAGWEVILEVGPGLGSLTRHLAAAARQVIAVELDEKLIPPLQEVLAPFDNVMIVHGDILHLDPAELLSGVERSAESGERGAESEERGATSVERRVEISNLSRSIPAGGQSPISNYIVVANIPYYITSALIRHLLEAKIQPQRIVLTVQKEVAMRICAAPPNTSLLALSVQVYGKPRIAAHIPAGAFYPAPQVDSAVVRIDLFPAPLIPVPLLPTFFRLAKSGFGQKRKNLRNSLSAGMAWSKEKTEENLRASGIDPRRRAETLSLEEWGTLVTYVSQ